MTNYRTDETADLRRRIDDLELKLDMADGELKHANDRRAQFEKARNEAEAELRRIKEGGVPREKVVLAAQSGFSFALFTVGMFSAALIVCFTIAALFSSCRGCGGPSESVDNATGVITDRYHYDTRSYTTCSGTRPVVCTTHVIPEHWSVRVAHDGHEREVSLSREDWSETQVGAPWCERPPCAPIYVTEER